MATGVNINWQGQAIKTRSLETTATRLRIGDFIVYRGEMTRVEAVQTDCPHLENLMRVFCMVTLETRAGDLIPVRQLGRKTVYRKAR